MFDLLAKAFEALGPWPIVQFAAAILIVYGVLCAMNRGEKDRKSGTVVETAGETTPRWFANEQTLELLRDIKTELHQQSSELHHHSSLLEQIANENVINPRRLQE